MAIPKATVWTPRAAPRSGVQAYWSLELTDWPQKQDSFDLDAPCAVESVATRADQVITEFSVPGGQSITLVHGHAGSLPTGEGQSVYAIAVDQAQVGFCCHNTDYGEVLLQRVQ
jgi:hypothetical protein